MKPNGFKNKTLCGENNLMEEDMVMLRTHKLKTEVMLKKYLKNVSFLLV